MKIEDEAKTRREALAHHLALIEHGVRFDAPAEKVATDE